MNKLTYIDIISNLLDDDEPIYALITSELVSANLPHDIEVKQKTDIRMAVVDFCCQAIKNGDAELLWEYKEQITNIESALVDLKTRHTLSPINIYTFEQAPCYFYGKYSGDFVLKLTDKGERLCSKFPV